MVPTPHARVYSVNIWIPKLLRSFKRARVCTTVNLGLSAAQGRGQATSHSAVHFDSNFMLPPFMTLPQDSEKKKFSAIGHPVEFAALREIWNLKQGIGTVREVWMASLKQKDSFHFLCLAEASEQAKTSLNIYSTSTMTQVPTFINDSSASFLNILTSMTTIIFLETLLKLK